MRVLIYVEPHPIRGSQTMFNDVARKFLPLLAGSTPDFDVRMFITKAVEGAVGEKALAGLEKRLIKATGAEEAFFRGHLSDWETEGIPVWLSLMSGGEAADDYLGVLRRIWSVFPYDVIVHWGENGAITRFLEERPVTRIAMELGCTRPPFLSTIVMDPFGTNGSATVPRLSLEQLRSIVDDHPMSAAEAIYGYSANVEALPYEQQFMPLDGGAESARLLAASGRIAFLPLQLHDDANLLRFSKYSTVEEVVLDAVPRLAAAGFMTVIKTHPDAKSRHQSQAAFSLAREALRPWAEHVIWLDANRVSYSNAQLSSLAELVVTVNSSVGFEALYFDKVVSVLGDAVYKPQGLFPDLDDAIAGNFDKEAYLHGIGLLRRFMLGGYMAGEAVRGLFSPFERITLAIDAARRKQGGDPAAVAHDMYRSLSVTRQHQTRMRLVRGGSVPGANEFGLPPLTTTAPAAEPGADGAASTRTPFTSAARRLLSLTGAVDGAALREELLAAFGQAETAEALVRASGILDESFYLANHKDVAKAAKDPVEHWVGYGHREGRKLRAGLAVTSLEHLVDELVDAATVVLEDDGLPSFPLSEDEAVHRAAGLDAVRQQVAKSDRAVAVVAHLYYRDLVPQLLDRLRAIPEPFDLIATIPVWGGRHIKALVLDAFPNAIVYDAPTRGRDVGPLLDVLPAVLEHDYDALLHIRTEAGYQLGGRLRSDLDAVLRDEALDALLGSEARVAAIFDALRAGTAVQQIGPAEHFVSLRDARARGGNDLAELLLGEADGAGCFASGMFWARPSSLRALVGPGGLSLTSFPADAGSQGGPLVRDVTQAFGHAAAVAQGVAVGAPTDPEAPLVTELDPIAGSLQQHLQTSLVTRQALQRSAARGALAW